MQFDVVEARVVGSLVEKELTTPQQYPLTLNALVLACNQSSNREPVLLLSETEVQRALESLKTMKLVRFVFPSHGRSAVRYRHVLDEVARLDERQRSLVAVLLLRGPQTLGELRTRTERMASFSGLGDVESELRHLADRSEPLVERLGRRPGQKEERFAHLLASAPTPDEQSPMAQGATTPAAAGGSGGAEVGGDAAAAGRPVFGGFGNRGEGAGGPATPVAADARMSSDGRAAIAGGPPGGPGRAPAGEVEALRVAVEELRREVASMRQELDELNASLGG